MATAYVPISKVTLTSAQTDVTLANIPQIYKDIRVVVNGWGSAEINVGVRVNNDSGSNYTQVNMRGYGGQNVYASSTSTGTSVVVNYSTGQAANDRGIVIYDFLDYSVTDKHKFFLIRANHQGEVDSLACKWSSTSAITAVTVLSAFSAGSTISLYGIVG